MFIQKLNKISFVFFIVLFSTLLISQPLKATPCAAGTFSDDGEEPCAPCEPGTFQADEGAMSCSECPPGRYQDEAGQIECNLCDPGTYQDLPGAIECSDCEAGTFQSNEGSSTCANCAEGSYSDTGSAECASECGDEITFSDEECDDGNSETLDGCAIDCTYETNTELEDANSSINFSTLATNEPLAITSPHFASLSNCSCTWSINPSSAGSLSGGISCRQFLTPSTLGEANLAVAEDCSSTSLTTFNQTLVITSEGTAPSGSCRFSLTSMTSEKTVLLTLLFFISVVAVRLRVKIN